MLAFFQQVHFLGSIGFNVAYMHSSPCRSVTGCTGGHSGVTILSHTFPQNLEIQLKEQEDVIRYISTKCLCMSPTARDNILGKLWEFT